MPRERGQQPSLGEETCPPRFRGPRVSKTWLYDGDDKVSNTNNSTYHLLLRTCSASEARSTLYTHFPL